MRQHKPHQPQASIPPHATKEVAPEAQKTEFTTKELSLSSDNFPRRVPSLDYDSLRRIETWPDLKNAYQLRGIEVTSDQKLLELIKVDWRIIKQDLWDQALIAQIPTRFPSAKVALGDEEIEIFGFWHTLGMHPEVNILFRRTLAEFPLLITEQNLGGSNYGIHTNGIEIPDHTARGIFQATLNNELRQIESLKRTCKRIMLALKRSPRVKDSIDSTFVVPSSEKGSELESLQKKLGIYNKTLATFSRLGLTIPGDWGNELPANIELAYKHFYSIRYTITQARSAYMAEFLRHWDLPKTLERYQDKLGLELCSALSNKKQIACGQAHQPEIAFFLKQGCREAKVTERARSIAEVLNERGVEELIRAYEKEKALYTTATMASALLKGAGIGWLIVSAF